MASKSWQGATRFLVAMFVCAWTSAAFAQPDLLSGLGGKKEEKKLVKFEAEIYEATDKLPAEIAITAKIDKGWHLYSLTQGGTYTKTKLTIPPNDDFTVGDFKSNPPPRKHKDPADETTILEEHEKQVTWTAPLELAAGVDIKDLKISGTVKYQLCNDKSCLMPETIPFVATLAERKEVAAITPAAEGDEIKAQFVGESGASSLAIILGFSVLGGFILNFMPCVLPVIGLKIFAFVEQAGHDRKEIFWLNVWYSLGLMSVFMVLASVAVVASLWGSQFGWGNQFAYPQFTIPVAAIVFAMALSFLGVWEIPIPGFAGGSKAHSLSSREGPMGAFSKGIFATLLATPCTGPFLGTVLSFAATQPPLITYAVFGAIGFGMALPYLLIGAFPGLLRFLPKPGAWMETFKQLLGFFLIGTAIYLLTILKGDLVIPTVAFLAGLSIACWWIGRTPMYAPFGAKARAWGVAAVVTAAAAYLFFGFTADKTHRLDWQPYSTVAFEDLKAKGKTVVIDFTADWCPNCKALERFVLNTSETKKSIDKLNAVTLVADITHLPEEEMKLLRTLTSSTNIPVLAIFPGERPNQPIVLRDVYSKSTLLENLQKAGPSRANVAEEKREVLQR